MATRPLQPAVRRLAKREDRVTIAAGFNFDHGVLLCADTKHTGSMALYQSKVYHKECLNGAKCAFVFSGTVGYSQMAIRKIEQAIEVLTAPTIAEMEAAIEDVILRIHKEHLYVHPDWNTASRPEVSLLIGLWSPTDDELMSYKTEETAVIPFYGYDCVGSGSYLGHYIIRPRYHGRSGGLESVVFTALTALDRIKRFDAFCGGYSDFVVISDNGDITEKSRFDIETGEKFSQFFYESVNLIYEGFAKHPPDPLTDEETRQVVERIMKVVADKRTELEQGHTRLEQLYFALSKQSSGQRLTDQK